MRSQHQLKDMTEYINHPLIKPNTIEARIYQQVLFAAAVEKNTLVILPTGLGKTVLFVMLAAHSLQSQPEKKVIITAPTKPLVEQHANTLRSMLALEGKEITVLDGSIPPAKRKEFYHRARIISATPQVLRNDVIDGKLDLSQISLICFDEAHRAVGDYAYPILAKEFKKKNPNGRILAITASPGSEENMREVVSNLYIEQVEHRDEKSPDVRPYVQSIEEEIVKVELPPEFKQIRDILRSLLKSQLAILKKAGVIRSEVVDNNRRNDLLKAQKLIVRLKDEGSLEAKDYFAALGASANAIRISHALELLETQGIPPLHEYLKSMKREASKQNAKRSLVGLVNSSEMRKVLHLVEVLSEEKMIHPKFPKLLRIVEQQLRKAPNSRILVFAHFRNTAKNLADELNKLPIASATWFVGQASKGKDRGLSQKDQIRILENFREGVFNVLVATSVAEEGLDISQVDLVVFYDIVPSATRAIQRRGRTGRKKQGRVVLLVAKGTRDEGYFWAAKRKEREMKSSSKELAELIDPRQKSLLDFAKNDESPAKEKRKHSATSAETDSDKKTSVSLLDFDDSQTKENSLSYEKENEKTPPSKVEIWIDPQEKASSLINTLMDFDAEIYVMKGGGIAGSPADYVVSDRVGIQRKSVVDFVTTLQKPGRENLFTILKELKNHYSKPVLIIEGEELYGQGIHPAAIRGAITAIAVDLGIAIIQTRNTEDSAKYIFTLAKREQLENRRPVRLSKVDRTVTRDEVLVSMLSQIPGVEATLARRILERFPTLNELIKSSKEDLQSIKGIGPRIANEIIQHLHHRYRRKISQ